MAQFLATQAERRLEMIASVETTRQRPPVYELPPGADEAGPTLSR